MHLTSAQKDRDIISIGASSLDEGDAKDIVQLCRDLRLTKAEAFRLLLGDPVTRRSIAESGRTLRYAMRSAVAPMRARPGS